MQKSLLVIIESSRSYDEIEEVIKEFKMNSPKQEEMEELVEKIKDHLETAKLEGRTNIVNKLTYALSFFKKRRR